MSTIKIELEATHEAQEQVLSNLARFNVVDCGRRWGKDVLARRLYIEPGLHGKFCAWFNPNFTMLTDTWREVSSLLYPITKRANAQEHRIELITGGILDMWSLDAANSARGRRYHRVIINEAAFAPNLMDAFNDVIRPTLIDYQGDAFFFSTPKGKNAFHTMYQWGLDGKSDWRSFNFPTSTNPFIPAGEIELARQSMTERAFRQELLAEFIDDGGGVFRNVRPCAIAQRVNEPLENHTYVAGLDWALSNDYTVLSIIDATDKALVYIDRFNGIDYSLQRERIKATCERFGVRVVVAEENAMGKPNNDMLRRMGVKVRDFTTTATTKADIIEELAASFERGAIKIINDPILIGELEAYESERSTSGGVKYNAPQGMHDDLVMSLALGWSNVRQRFAYG